VPVASQDTLRTLAWIENNRRLVDKLSGGDALPYYFKQQKIGPLVGTRTWGALVGTLGIPATIDGGGLTAPSLAFDDLKRTLGGAGSHETVEKDTGEARAASRADRSHEAHAVRESRCADYSRSPLSSSRCRLVSQAALRPRPTAASLQRPRSPRSR